MHLWRCGAVKAGSGRHCLDTGWGRAFLPGRRRAEAMEWQVVQPAALRHFNQPVRSISHFGSYSCRRIYGRSHGHFSEHATADAIDISAFRLKDGRRISVVNDWKGEGKDAAFLHDVRDGACALFSTVLSPDYNAAHRDHFHLDQAERGATGRRACR